MSELRVPTLAVEVEILYADEMQMAGTIFLPSMAHWHPGPARPEEWINDNVPFFPFREPTRKDAVLLNKDRVVVMTLPVGETAEAVADEERASVYKIASARIECAGKWFEGTVRIEMPEGKLRVLDYINRPERFLALYSGHTCHLIRKIHIDRVVELREE